MKRVWTALGLVLALTAFMPRASQAQANKGKKPSVTLGQNYPNPFNPETRIDFTVGDVPTCADNGKQYRVSLKIYNLVSQMVAIPVLQGSGSQLNSMLIPCGKYTAYWDGKVLNSGREAASGVYYYRIEVDGYPMLRTMISVK